MAYSGPIAFAALLAAFIVSACAGGGTEEAPAPAPAIDFADPAMAVIKVRPSADGVTILEEKPTPITQPGPQRRVALLDPSGRVRGTYEAPAGSSIIDLAQHASGEVTVGLATAKAVTIVRLDRLAHPISQLALVDPLASQDPFYDSGGIHDDASMVPVFTRDAMRLAAAGDDGQAVLVALRTGRNAVVAYRFDYAQAAGYTRAWRTLVEPGVSMFGVGITSGTFDTFGQLENHFHVHLDADAQGNAVVAVVGKGALAPVFPAHADFFHQPVAISSGALVTRLGSDGRRIGTTFIDFVGEGEVHGMRMHPGGVALAGRLNVFETTDGTGWLGFAADVDLASGNTIFFKTVDVQRSDALFDIAALPGGDFVAGGTAGYVQNPRGASISEASAPLLVILERDGNLRRRLDYPAGPRQNQVRSIAPRGERWLIGSLQDGPGTHSGDSDPASIRAEGSIREIALPLQ